jgi:hypothetical protein
MRSPSKLVKVTQTGSAHIDICSSTIDTAMRSPSLADL